MGFCAKKGMKTMAKSHHLDLRVIQLSAEMPPAFRGRAGWTGNEKR